MPEGLSDWEFWHNGIGQTVFVSEREPLKLLDATGKPIYFEKREPFGFDLTNRNTK
jgi:hypothetical protein